MSSVSQRQNASTPYVTQKDIARLANVSQSAVAAALGRTDKIRVSAETREKVLKAAAQLNYLPNQSASVTRSGRTKQIALLLQGTTTHAISNRLKRLTSRLREAGLGVMPHELQWSEIPLEEAWDQALATRAEAIVLSSGFGTIHAPMYKRLLNSPVPVISLCGPAVPGIPLVAPDYRRAFCEITRRLLQSGRRNLVMLKRFRAPDPIVQIEWKGAERMDGFMDAVREANAESTCRVIEVWNRNPAAPKSEYELGMQGLAEALAEGKGRVPDALVCANDRFAHGVILEAMRRAIALPDQMKVTGCDGECWTGYGAMPITTIEQPSVALADRAAEILLEMLEGRKPSEERVSLPCNIIWRESCARDCLD